MIQKSAGEDQQVAHRFNAPTLEGFKLCDLWRAFCAALTAMLRNGKVRARETPAATRETRALPRTFPLRPRPQCFATSDAGVAADATASRLRVNLGSGFGKLRCLLF